MEQDKLTRTTPELAAWGNYQMLLFSAFTKTDQETACRFADETERRWRAMRDAGLRELLAYKLPDDDIEYDKELTNYFLHLYERDGEQTAKDYWNNVLEMWRIYDACGITSCFDKVLPWDR